MPKSRFRSLSWLLMLTLVLGVGSGFGAAAAQDAAEDARTFRRYLDDTSSLPIVFGPEEGELAHEEDTLSVELAGVDLRDFVVHAEFVNPYAASTADWDIGLLFRLGEEEPHMRLIVTSSGNWFLAPSTEDPIASGEVADLNVGPDQRNAIDLVAAGDTGYFGVNGEYVATLDLSAVDGSGDIAVATSFSPTSFQEAAITGYEDFLVWELTEEEATPAPDEATPEPEEATPSPEDEGSPAPEEDATPLPDDTAAAGRYESQEFGFALDYDDTWTVEDESVEEGFDYVRLGNGVSTVDITGLATDLTPEECVDDEFRYYEETEGYSDVQVALDVDDNEMRGEAAGAFWGVFWFTFTPEDGEPVEYTAYVECLPLVEGESLLKIVQFAPFDDYNDQIEARLALLGGLDLAAVEPGDETATPEPDNGEETATAEPDEEQETATPDADDGDATPAADGEDGDGLIVLVEATGESGESGLATIDADGERARVRLLVLGAEAGTLPLIQEGTCDALDPNPAFLLTPLDGNLSETTLRVSVDDLVAGDYAITLHAGVDDLTAPIACGEIAAAE